MAHPIPEMMSCIEISAPGGPDVLVPAQRPVPEPEHDEILIKVAAAGVNRPDALQRAGHYDPPKGASDLPGLEVSGTIVAKGSNVANWQIGDQVCALTPGGGYAEYCLTHADHALPIPEGLDMAEAAALPETFFTVWSNVFERGALQAGETLLIHGGSSGIGTTAIQLAKAFGARVFVTAGSEEKCAACRDLGAELAINYRETDFVEAVRAATDKRGVDVILDMVGGDYIGRNFKAAAMDGRIVNIAFLQGAKAEVNFALGMVKRLTWTGSTLRPRSIAYKAQLAEILAAKVWPKIGGKIGDQIGSAGIRPVMDQRFALSDAAAAHARMESSAHIGKIVLIP
ncbi:MAG: NAD(P)H-quinone oxidoreductase [Neomegalonema sp.]|nr:NAD(P)H-quinone oxidoreductase [Neomegalonema sp.]